MARPVRGSPYGLDATCSARPLTGDTKIAPSAPTRKRHRRHSIRGGLSPDSTGRSAHNLRPRAPRSSPRNGKLADVNEPECTVPINSERDIVLARQKGRALAFELGFSVGNATLIATTISELARNIVSYAGKGQIAMSAVRNSDRTGITIVASDSGPGIADLTLALREGFSTSGGLGMGLPGARRLMDEFDVNSQPGRGTIITVTKWKS